MSIPASASDSFCITILGITRNIYIVITYELIQYDLQLFYSFNTNRLLSSSDSSVEIWSIGMSLTFTLSWVLFLILVVTVRLYGRLANILGGLLLVLIGPNLLFWNIYGCIAGALTNRQVCRDNALCNNQLLVKTLTIFIWSLLYLVACIGLTGIGCIVAYIVRKLRITRRFKRWRNTHILGQELIEVTCSICLDNFIAGQRIRTLPRCGHIFHEECIDIWLENHENCPVCRQEY